MRVAHIAPTALSNISAAWRIKAAQQKIGIDALSVVHIGSQADDTILFDTNQAKARRRKSFLARVDGLPLRAARKLDRSLPWSTAWYGYDVSNIINESQIDIANFHWLTNGTVSLRKLRNVQAPVVLTLHDVWALTGGCHCNLGCDNWISSCTDCPQLKGNVLGVDLANKLWNLKRRAFANIPQLEIVSPSNWLANMAKSSSMFAGRRVSVIPNCLDTDVFCPGSQDEARKRIGLSTGKRILGFGAVQATTVSYKGYDLLLKALDYLSASTELDFEIVVFGSEDSGQKLPYPAKFLGTISDEQVLADIYRSIDVFATPSRQDNLPNTVVEATACGTPVVAFDIGGMSDLIVHGQSGYLARPFDVADFAKGVDWLLSSPTECVRAGEASTKFTSAYCSREAVAKKYRKLYTRAIKEFSGLKNK